MRRPASSCSTRCTGCCASWRARGSPQSPPSTQSRLAGAASWRWRVTSGSRHSPPASASRRSTSGSSPGSAAPSGCRVWWGRKALELNLTGEPIAADEAYELGLATRVVPDHELLDTALAWARKLAGQAPIAVEQIKTVAAAGDLDAGIEAEKRGFATAFGSEDAREGISAFLQKRTPKFTGK